MIDINALFKLSYGLYIVSTGDKSYGNGYVANTFFQITSSPAQFATCCNKDNHSAAMIEKYGCFTVSILHENADSETIGKFGFKTGKDINKMTDSEVKYGQTGAPITTSDSVAYLECKLVNKIDVGTHYLFVGELIAAELLNDKIEPLTYATYRKVKKGLAPKNAPTYVDKTKIESQPEKPKAKQYRCAICGYVHDENEEHTHFDDLPDDWTCPICSATKEDFVEL